MSYASSEWLQRLAVLLLCILTLVNFTQAFFPTTWRQKYFGNNGVSHEQQTIEAFETLAGKYFPRHKKLTRSMTQARDAIAGANANVDQDFDHSAYHCDGENFDGAQARLTELRNQVVTKLRIGKADEARKALGSALHTIQDFYSHSNWVEMGNTQPHPDLGRGRPIAHADFSNATCTACGPTAQKDSSGCPICSRKSIDWNAQVLTSGYAFLEDSPINLGPIPENKCHHGGYIDSPKGAVTGFVTGILTGQSLPGINKDSLNCGFSPHSQYHRSAVDLAIEASIQYIDDVKQNLSDSQLRQLFGVGRTFAFLIDTTPIIRQLLDLIKSSSIKIAQDDLQQDSEANGYIVAHFDGGSIRTVVETVDFEVFKSTVRSLDRPANQAQCLGLPLEGILNTVKSLRVGSSMFLMAGAFPPNDALASEIISTAYEKDITIHSFHYRGGCMGDFSRLRIPFKLTSVYDSFAAATGGSSFTQVPSGSGPGFAGMNIPSWIPTSWMGQKERRAEQFHSGWLSRGDGARILKIRDTLTIPIPGKNYNFPVDSTVTELKISFRSRGGFVAIVKPGGADLAIDLRRPFTSGVSSTQVEGAQFFTIKSPASGMWKAVISGAPGEFTFDAYGTSQLYLSSFEFTRLAGRPGHQGFFPLPGPPTANSDVAMTARIRGDFKTAIFGIRNPAGKAVASPVMTPGSGELGEAPKNAFFGMGRLLKGEYQIYVTGKNGAGETFQRMWPTTVQPR